MNTWWALALWLVLSPTAVLANGGASGPALVRVWTTSKVGFLLDEIPKPMRDRVADRILSYPSKIWIEKAKRQIALADYFLSYRRWYYRTQTKAQLPLPPEEVWTVSLSGTPNRELVRGSSGSHDYVAVDFSFETYLVVDAQSLAKSEPALSDEGVVWREPQAKGYPEPFPFPIDPDLIHQRTGEACLDRIDYPAEEMFSETAPRIFDHTCDAKTGPGTCHPTQARGTELSCTAAIDKYVGSSAFYLNFMRVPWDDGVASAYRTGEPPKVASPDLTGSSEALATWVTWRYFPKDSCAVRERCVAGQGWRKLLLFDGMVLNTGGAALEVGNTEPNSDLLTKYNLYEHSDCHNHNHMRYFSDYAIGDKKNASFERKQGYCVIDDFRWSNNEYTPLNTPYDDCNALQGISRGWADLYSAGIDCQWLDITDLPRAAQEPQELEFTVNSKSLLCEGTVESDQSGRALFEPTDLYTLEGNKRIWRAKCRGDASTAKNNTVRKIVDVSTPVSALPCRNHELGAAKDCGFVAQSQSSIECPYGQTLQMRCESPRLANPQGLRFCAHSPDGEPHACTFESALANVTQLNATERFELTCPRLSADDGSPTKVLVSVYKTHLFEGDSTSEVGCQTVQR